MRGYKETNNSTKSKQILSSCLNLLGDGDHAHNAMNGMGHDGPPEVENTMLLAFETVACI